MLGMVSGLLALSSAVAVCHPLRAPRQPPPRQQPQPHTRKQRHRHQPRLRRKFVTASVTASDATLPCVHFVSCLTAALPTRFEQHARFCVGHALQRRQAQLQQHAVTGVPTPHNAGSWSERSAVQPQPSPLLLRRAHWRFALFCASHAAAPLAPPPPPAPPVLPRRQRHAQLPRRRQRSTVTATPILQPVQRCVHITAIFWLARILW